MGLQSSFNQNLFQKCLYDWNVNSFRGGKNHYNDLRFGANRFRGGIATPPPANKGKRIVLWMGQTVHGSNISLNLEESEKNINIGNFRSGNIFSNQQ